MVVLVVVVAVVVLLAVQYCGGECQKEAVFRLR